MGGRFGIETTKGRVFRFVDIAVIGAGRAGDSHIDDFAGILGLAASIPGVQRLERLVRRQRRFQIDAVADELNGLANDRFRNGGPEPGAVEAVGKRIAPIERARCPAVVEQACGDWGLAPSK